MRLPCCLVLAPLLAACHHSNHPQDPRLRGPVPSQGAELALALYQLVGVEPKLGHKVELVEDSHLPEVLEAEAQQAQVSLHVLASTWEGGPNSERLLQALAQRQPAAACRVLVDTLRSPSFHTQVAPRLRAAGCEVRAFRPVAPGMPARELLWRARNLRQLVIRDGRSGVVGSAGWVPSSGAWRSLHVRVEGPAVGQMQQNFAESWMESGGTLLPAEAFPALEAVGGARAAWVASTGSPHLSNAERLLRLLAAAARHRLWLANACVAPEQATADMLWLRAAEGVDVRVLVPAQGQGDCGPLSPAPGGQRLERSQQRGVRLWVYTSGLLRERLVLVDDTLVAVGPFNLEVRSHELLEEGALVVEDAELARSLAQHFEQSLERAVELR